MLVYQLNPNPWVFLYNRGHITSEVNLRPVNTFTGGESIQL